MDRKETFSILRTCIIGEAFRACGLGFDPEDNLDVYNLGDVEENVDPEDIKGPFPSPDAFLETECSSDSKRIYETIYLMECSWMIGANCLHKEWQRKIGRKLWELGREEAIHYMSTYGEDEESDLFEKNGETLYG